MPVYRLPAEPIFPRPDHAAPEGLLAVGGDLGVERLLAAYSAGIFPWYGEGDPILWWSPHPRLVLEPGEITVSKSLRRTLKKKLFAVTLDRAFPEVIRRCALIARRGQPGTWIVPEMVAAYTALHRAGFAHSVEAWLDDDLAGGLYGVSLGRAFFGESMFADRTDASKVCLVYLAALLRRWRFDLIDCQVTTRHLERMGAREISRREFLARLQHALAASTRTGRWQLPPDFEPLL